MVLLFRIPDIDQEWVLDYCVSETVKKRYSKLGKLLDSAALVIAIFDMNLGEEGLGLLRWVPRICPGFTFRPARRKYYERPY
ncbi:MAG TPA: hypothetical protein DEG93_07840 [Gammaproteobacteria bacterium]|nr:hypothetical protein [Gammaproteobacteria bacterium]